MPIEPLAARSKALELTTPWKESWPRPKGSDAWAWIEMPEDAIYESGFRAKASSALAEAAVKFAWHAIVKDMPRKLWVLAAASR